MYSAAGLFLITAMTAASFLQNANAAQIYTGGTNGAYHTVFCPLIKQNMGELGRDYNCVTSNGSSANIKQIARNPFDFGFAQLDAFALDSASYGRISEFEIIRSGDVRECVFAVTRQPSLTSFGQIAVAADRLKFILPPKDSGSMRTFDYLRRLDKDGLGRARNIIEAIDIDDAILRSLADDGAVTFFVQFPDPNNERFRKIRRLGGHIVPVVDQTLLDAQIDGQRVYYAQETDIGQTSLLKFFGEKVITACTPMILFTGSNRSISLQYRRETHAQLVSRLQSMPSEDFVPKTGPFSKFLNRTKNLSEQTLASLIRSSSNARERAQPFLQRTYYRIQRAINIMILKARPQT